MGANHQFDPRLQVSLVYEFATTAHLSLLLVVCVLGRAGVCNRQSTVVNPQPSHHLNTYLCIQGTSTTLDLQHPISKCLVFALLRWCWNVVFLASSLPSHLATIPFVVHIWCTRHESRTHWGHCLAEVAVEVQTRGRAPAVARPVMQLVLVVCSGVVHSLIYSP